MLSYVILSYLISSLTLYPTSLSEGRTSTDKFPSSRPLSLPPGDRHTGDTTTTTGIIIY